MESVKLIECINTWQGEGPDSGKRMLLCRFKYCNRTCPWCDTMVKMRVQQEADYSLEQLQETINQEKVGLMITGGEPTMKTKPHNQLDSTVLMLNKLTYPIANVETNGSRLEELMNRVKTSKPINYIYSPKIFARYDLEDSIKETNRILLFSNVYIKIVYESSELLKEYLLDLHRLKLNGRVYIMPEGKTRDELIKHAPEVFDIAEKLKFNFSSRQHVIYDFI